MKVGVVLEFVVKKDQQGAEELVKLLKQDWRFAIKAAKIKDDEKFYRVRFVAGTMDSGLQSEQIITHVSKAIEQVETFYTVKQLVEGASE